MENLRRILFALTHRGCWGSLLSPGILALGSFVLLSVSSFTPSLAVFTLAFFCLVLFSMALAFVFGSVPTPLDRGRLVYPERL